MVKKLLRQNLLNLTLLIAIIAVSIWYWVQYSNEKTVPSLAKGVTVTELTISYSENKLQFLKKEDWLLTHPFSARADQAKLRELANYLESTIIDTIGSVANLNLSTYALNQPTVTLILNNHSIAFGNQNPVTQQRYVRYQDLVYLIENYRFSLISKNPYDLLDKNLIPTQQTIMSIEVQSTKNFSSNFTITKEKLGADYVITGREDKQLTAKDINSWIDAVSFISADSVAPRQITKQTPIKPSVTITITLANGTTQKYDSFVNDQLIREDIAAGVVYFLNPTDYQRLLTPPSHAGTTGS
ncbi:MAG: DUF4340 domain-containing protein [Methylacidiphilales bacterium]|nr:DUF4340 domain-containing protein [Candidatus Methylacidiphilales bacterium]